MGILHRRYSHITPLHCRVGATLDKVNPRHRWQSHDVIHRVDLGVFNKAHHHQTMLAGINVPPSLMMTLKVQAARRDNSKGAL